MKKRLNYKDNGDLRPSVTNPSIFMNVKGKLKKEIKRLTPRIFNSRKSSLAKDGDLKYVLFDDIKKFHDKNWVKKYIKASGPANTCAIIPANDKSHGLKEDQIGIYYHDYLRFADVVDYNIPTYWD